MLDVSLEVLEQKGRELLQKNLVRSHLGSQKSSCVNVAPTAQQTTVVEVYKEIMIREEISAKNRQADRGNPECMSEILPREL